MVMNVMHVDDVWLRLINPFQEPLCLSLIIESMMSCDFCPKLTDKKLSNSFYSINRLLFLTCWIIIKSKGGIALNSISLCDLLYFSHDSAGTTIAIKCIYLKHFHLH